MPKLLATKLDLSRCPHCNVDSPNLNYVGQFDTADYQNNHRYWRIYACGRCAGIVTATAPSWDHEVKTIYPSSLDVSGDIPDRARAYLDQAINSLDRKSVV